MHLTEGEIQAYWDQELPEEARERISAHLSSCETCRVQAEDLLARSQLTQARLKSLSSQPQPVLLSPQAAQLRLADRMHSLEKENTNMFRTFFNRLSRPAWAALAIVALLAVSMLFAPIRAIASSFLGLFRVQQISVVEVNPDAIASELANLDQFEALMDSSFQVEQAGETQDVASPEEAAQVAGYPVRLPAMEGKNLELSVQPGGTATIQIDLDRIQALLDEIGRSDVRLPKEIDGAVVTLTASPGVMARYGECSLNQNRQHGEGWDPDIPQGFPLKDCTVFMQLPSPEINAPDGLDVQALGTAYLQMLGLSQADAQAFASNVDWTSTLVVPVPRSRAKYREVSVDGVTGTVISQKAPSSRLGEYALIWVKDGMVYTFAGPGDGSDAIQYANSLR